MRLIVPAAATAAVLLLAGCGGDDDEGGDPGAGGFASGGAGFDSGGGGEDSGTGGLPEIPEPELDDDLQLETTGGFGSGGDSASGPEASGPEGSAPEGSDDWYAHWESDGITLYTTTDGVLYGNSGTGDVCTQDVGLTGAIDWEPVLLTCGSGPANATLRLSGDTMAIEWSDRTEEVSRVESLAGQTVDLDSLEATILN
jgi:hypothetical protein